MKKTEAARRPRLLLRTDALLNRLSIRTRIFGYFLLLVALLLLLLWLFQVVLLDHFYRYQKTRMLSSSVESIVANIDNEDLSSLANRISEANGVCVLVVDGEGAALVQAESSPGCIIHHMSKRDLRQFMITMDDSGGEEILRSFPMIGFRDNKYDQSRFSGRVPSPDKGDAQSVIAMRKTTMADGESAYVFLNAVVTPIDATVDTLRSQLIFISVLMVLLSFLISLVLSRRITRPIVDTNEAAKALSEAEFTPAKTPVSYREITELNATLSQAAVDLRRVEAMQRELIANISHDLRTPLTLIEGYAEVMRDLPGENTPENMQVIIDETKRLSTLVNAVLDYSVTRSGSSGLDCRVFDLTQSILNILTRYQKLIEQDGYHIVFACDGHIRVNADETKVGQVIYNLINNALTYTGDDKTVTVRQTVRADGKALIEVIDTGEGIDQNELPYVWNRYYRGQKPHKRAAVGTGLGLSIVQGILDQHGLEYGVTSRQGEGTTFWFALSTEE
ncbi:MAG: HAMP domain-containing sensor histidine kinase [Eubacteriales bacterium]|nr:HAMP domain-containing sensor histidine kinase [Eubacteriales bacterium]